MGKRATYPSVWCPIEQHVSAVRWNLQQVRHGGRVCCAQLPIPCDGASAQCAGACSLRLTVVYGACGTFPSPMTGNGSLAKVPLEPPFAMVCASAASTRPEFKLLVRARYRRASSTSSRVLRALYTYGLCTAGRVCEHVIHVAS